MSGRSTKAFLDANTLIGGLLFKGNETTLLELGRVKAIELVTNHYVMEEVSAALKRREFSLTTGEVNTLIKYLYTCITVEENPPKEAIHENIDLLEDKKDILGALGATYSGSDYLVTGDKELLDKIPCSTTIVKILENVLP